MLYIVREIYKCAPIVLLLVVVGCGSGSSGYPCGATECGARQFCMAPDGICAASGGVCTEVGDVCPELYAPVCGCDGVTYASRCVATGHRMSIASEGECAASTAQQE